MLAQCEYGMGRGGEADGSFTYSIKRQSVPLGAYKALAR